MKKHRRFKKASDIKAGVIGYGPSFMMGKHHLDSMTAAGMQICAVADIDEERCKAAAKDFPGIETYPSAEKMMAESDVDLVTIITPHNSHAELAIQCMDAGRHVITEKPFAVTTDECDAMIAARDRNKVMLSTYHNRHWDGWIINAKKKIESGIIGKIVRIDGHIGRYQKPGNWWRGSKSISGRGIIVWTGVRTSLNMRCSCCQARLWKSAVLRIRDTGRLPPAGKKTASKMRYFRWYALMTAPI